MFNFAAKLYLEICFRNLRFFALFVMIYTWYVFEKFGGQSIRGEDGTVEFMHMGYTK